MLRGAIINGAIVNTVMKWNGENKQNKYDVGCAPHVGRDTNAKDIHAAESARKKLRIDFF